MALVMQEKASFPPVEGRTIKNENEAARDSQQEILSRLLWETDEQYNLFSYTMLKNSSLDNMPNFSGLDRINLKKLRADKNVRKISGNSEVVLFNTSNVK